MRAERNTQMDCTIQEGGLWLSQNGETLHFEPVVLKAAT